MIPLPTIATRIAASPAVSFPRTLEKLDALCRSETANVDVVSAVTATDPLLTALVIGHAATPDPVSSLPAAVMKLGMAAVRGLFRASQPIPEDRRAALASCWGLANATATMAPIVAEGVARHLRTDVDPALLHLSALFHDLGTALAILHYGDQHRQAAARCELGEAGYDHCLRRCLGVKASDLGLILARAWHLPDAVLPSMRWHDAPTASAHDDLPFDETCAIVHVSRLLVRAVGFTADGDPFLPPLDETVMRQWQLTTPLMEDWLNSFYTSMEELELYESVLIQG